MISHLNGGNTAQPPTDWPEPDWSGVGWDGRLYEQDEERRIVRMLRGGPFSETPSCPRPAPTPERTARAVQHRINTAARRANPMAIQPWQFPLFDDEPAQRCREVCHVQDSE